MDSTEFFSTEFYQILLKFGTERSVEGQEYGYSVDYPNTAICSLYSATLVLNFHILYSLLSHRNR